MSCCSEHWYPMPRAWPGLVLVFRGARELRIVVKGRAVPAAAPVLACLLVVGWQGTAGIRRPPAWHRLHRELAEYVRIHSQPGDLVAAREVGNIAYWTDRPMLDLLGVTDPTMVPELRLGRMEKAIEERRPAFVVTYVDRGEWRRNHRLVYTRWCGGEGQELYGGGEGGKRPWSVERNGKGQDVILRETAFRPKDLGHSKHSVLPRSWRVPPITRILRPEQHRAQGGSEAELHRPSVNDTGCARTTRSRIPRLRSGQACATGPLRDTRRAVRATARQ